MKRIFTDLVAAFALALALSVAAAGEGEISNKQREEYLRLARQGNVEAMFLVGAIGISEGKDKTEAAQWLAKAAERRHPKADFFLGAMYSQGDGVAQDAEKAAWHMRRAALQGMPAAEEDCAHRALAAKRYDEGRKWLELAARQFHADAHIALSRLLAEPPDGGKADTLRAYMWLAWYTKSPRDRKTYDSTVNILKMLARQMTREQLEQADGMVRAMGGDDFTQKRNDKEPEIARAVKLIRDRKYDEAMTILEPLAEKGDAAAQYHLGGMYLMAEGVERDGARAKELFERAAAQGESRALYRLGRLCEDGRDMPRDYAKVMTYYAQAARKGMPFAIQNIGNLLTRGQGVKKNLEQARQVYLLTAGEGDPMSQLALGLINAEEEEPARDNLETFKWLILARPNLSPQIPQSLRNQCDEMIRELALILGDEGMEKGQELVRNFMPVEIDPSRFDWDSLEITS